MVDVKLVLELTAENDEDPVEALSPERTEPALGICVAFGTRIGVRTILMPSLRKTSSKGATELAVAVVKQAAQRFDPRLLQVSHRLPIGATKVTVDQRMGELLLPAHELEPVRLELVAVRVLLVQRLPLCDEDAERVL